MYPSLGLVFPSVFLIVICFPLLFPLSPSVNYKFLSCLSTFHMCQNSGSYFLDYPKPGSIFTSTISHTSQQGWGHEARLYMDLLRALSKAVTLRSCQLPPFCRDSLVHRRTEVHGAWLPSQPPLLHSSSGQTQQVYMTLGGMTDNLFGNSK